MSIELRRLSGSLGIEAMGFEPAADHPPDAWHALRDAVMEHCLVLIRSAPLRASRLVDVAGAFGAVMEHESAHTSEFKLPDAPQAYLISSARNGVRYAGQAWHSDYAYVATDVFSSHFIQHSASLTGGTSGSLGKSRLRCPMCRSLGADTVGCRTL